MMMMGYSAVMAVPNGELGQRASIQCLDRRKEEKQIPSPVFDGQWGALIVVAATRIVFSLSMAGVTIFSRSESLAFR